jgi:hypothetical protein
MGKKTLFIIVSTVILLITVQSLQAQPGGRGGGMGGGRGGGGRGGMGGGRGGMDRGMGQARSLVTAYDKNGDGWLNNEERKAARGLSSTYVGPRPAKYGVDLGTNGVKWYPAEKSLYDINTLRTIFLVFENPDWETELEYFYHTDVEVPAKMMVDGKTYENVGVRFRGNTSYQAGNRGWKRPLNISVDFINKNQYLYGYRTLNLLTSSSDATFIRQVLYEHIARQYIPALKANYVRLVINGESWGIYINYQQFNTDFLKDEFDTRKGARWKVPVNMGGMGRGGMGGGSSGLTYLGDNPALYKNIYEIKSKDDPNSWAALINLCKVLNQTPADKLEKALEPILDIDEALRFLAIDKALVNEDGYWTRASDFLVYQDTAGQFHVFPYDTSETMSGSGGGRGGRGGFGGGGGVQLDPFEGAYDSGKPLLSKLLAVPSLQRRYLGYIRDIAENWLDWNRIEPLVKQYQLLIAADIEKDNRKTSETQAFYSGTGLSGQQQAAGSSSFSGRGGGGSGTTIKSFMEQRRAYLLSLSQLKQAALP